MKWGDKEIYTMKEQELNEMEASNLPDIEFKKNVHKDAQEI